MKKNLIYNFLISNLLIFYLVFPTGIGLEVKNQNFDLNKISYLIILLIIFLINIKTRLSINLSHYFILLFIFSSLIFSVFWISSIQYVYLGYIIIFYVSAFWVGQIIFEHPKSFYHFINRISLGFFLSGICSLLYFNYGMFDIINELRPNAEAYLETKSRGDILGSGSILGYRGFLSNGNIFALDRFIWMTFSILGLIFAINYKVIKINNKILFISIFLGFLELILSQSRLFTILALLALLYLFYKININKILLLLSIIFLLLLVILFTDINFMYYIASVSSLGPIIGIESLTDYQYNFASDKRGLALIGLYSELNNIALYLSSGPLFFNEIEYLFGIPSDYYDDLSPIIMLLIEFGLLSWLILTTMIIYSYRMINNKQIKFISIMLLVIIIASITVYTPRMLFYIFFFMGAANAASKWKESEI